MLRKTVMIEPSLRLQSPENGVFVAATGDFRNFDPQLLNRERGDRPLDRKAANCGPSAFAR